MFRLFIFVIFASSSAQAEPTQCVAHRGNSSEFLENSMAAIQSAFEMGVPLVEFDVHHLEDGTPIVMHDKNLSRTVRNKSGKVCKLRARLKTLSLTEIRENCRLRNGEEIPTLQDVLDAWEESDSALYVEFKDMPSNESLALLNTYFQRRPEMLYVISFNEDHLYRVRRSRLISRSVKSEMRLLHISSKASGANLDFDGVAIRRISSRDLERFQERGLLVNTWTIDDPRSLRRYIQRGVDHLTSNRPADCLRLLR